MTQEPVLRRKTHRARPAPPAAEAPAPLIRILPRTIVRAFSSGTGLGVEVGAVSTGPTTPEEVPERLPEGAFLATLSRRLPGEEADHAPESGPGLVFCAAELHAGLIEALTIGRLAPTPPPPRRVTATDTALLGALFDRLLSGLAEAASETVPPAALGTQTRSTAAQSDAAMLAGWKVARPVIDPRLLAALLDEGGYRLIRAPVTLSSPSGQRSGDVGLVLPEGGGAQAFRASARRAGPAPVSAHGGDAAAGQRAGRSLSNGRMEDAVGPEAEVEDRFAAAIKAQVMAAPASLNAVLGRVRMPLNQVMALKVGDRLEMPLSQIETVEIIGVDGRRRAEARLGQARGMRALRVTRISEAVSLVASAASPVDPPAEDRFIPAGATAGKV